MKTIAKVGILTLIAGGIASVFYFKSKNAEKSSEGDAPAEKPQSSQENPSNVPNLPTAPPVAPPITTPLGKELDAIKKNGKFTSLSSAQLVFDNPSSIDMTKEDLLNVLKRSNMAYFDGKVATRMSLADMKTFLSNYAPKVSGFPIQKYNGGFDAAVFSDYTDYQLRKLLANGWWFALKVSTPSYVKAGANYVAYPFSLRDASENEESNLSMVMIPENVKGGDYAYAFCGIDGGIKTKSTLN